MDLLGLLVLILDEAQPEARSLSTVAHGPSVIKKNLPDLRIANFRVGQGLIMIMILILILLCRLR